MACGPEDSCIEEQIAHGLCEAERLDMRSNLDEAGSQQNLFDDEDSNGLTLQVKVETATTTTTITEVTKPKRKRKVKQENIGEEMLKTPKAPKARKRKDKSLRTLFREKLATLDLATLKRPWMATKSFRNVDTDEALKAWVDEVLTDKSRWIAPYKGAEPCPCVAVDTETIGLDTRILIDIQEARNPDGSKRLDDHGNVIWEATYEVMIEIAGVCLSVDGVSGIYIPINHENSNNVSRQAAYEQLQRLFNVSHLIFYNAKFDREVMRHTLGIDFREYPHFEDVQVLHFSNDPKADLDDDTFTGDAGGLKALSRSELGLDQIDLGHIGKVQAEWCPVNSSSSCTCSEDQRREVKHGTRVQYVPFTWVPTSIALWYAAADAICTWLLWFKMKDEAQGRVRVHKIDGEMVDTLTWIERQRFKIAEDPHRRMVNWHIRQMAERRENLRQIAVRMGWPELSDDDGNVIEDTKFNVDKKHLPKFLFEILRLEVVKKTEKGAPSTDKEAMIDLLKKYPDNEFLLALDAYKKYVALHPENLKFDPRDKSARIYLKQSVVAGGRLAASGGKFVRDGGFGLNVQAIKKVGGNWFVRGRVLDPDVVKPEDVEPHHESELHASCFKEVEESVLVGWKEITGQQPDGRGGSEATFTVYLDQFPEDIDATVEVTDESGDGTRVPKYNAEHPARRREAVYEKRKIKKQAPGIINNHIANFLGYSICLVPSCTTCADKFGILIEKGKLDANQVLNLRALFVAEDGWTFFSSDYSNIEMRVAANESGEPKFIDEFLYGAGDFHSLTASACFPEFNDPATSAAVRKTCRDLAKIINFALLYGGTKYAIFDSMRKKKPSITMKDTEKMVADYWVSVPVFKAYCEEKQRVAREEMRCYTGTGRVIKFDSAMRAEGIRIPTPEEWEQYWAYVRVRKRQREAEAAGLLEEAAHLKEVMDRYWKDPATGVRNCSDYNRFIGKIQRVAVNAPLQGLAGDFMRMALNRIRKWATKEEHFVQSVFRLHGSVHDEVDYTVKNSYVPFVVPRVTRLMKLRTLHKIRNWPVGIECDTEGGHSWDVNFHLTGDADHVPAGWTDIKGLEEYLPVEFDLDTVAHLVRAIVSGKESARAKVETWAKGALHERAFVAFWHALWTRDKEKKPISQTEETTIRKQVIAALQLHEYWSIDETADNAGETLETLAQYEQRRGLTPADRGFMPQGGFLGTMPIEGTRRPPLEPLVIPGTEGTEDHLRLEMQPLFSGINTPVEPSLSTSHTSEQSAGPVVDFREPESVKPIAKDIDASEMASDDLFDELLGKDLSKPSVRAQEAPSVTSAPQVAMTRRVVTAPQPKGPVEEKLPVLKEWQNMGEYKAFELAIGKGFGTHTLTCLYQGKVFRFEGCMVSAVPSEFLVFDAEEALKSEGVYAA
jgi:DNA polymerase I-like protein with 3'-5' exonuclease and polymerase domains